MRLFKTPENYKEMLDTIGWYTFSFLVLYMLIIRANISSIDSFLTKFEPNFNIPILGINFEFFTVFIPVFLAVFSRSIKLHDKLSNRLGIRSKFDVDHVLKRYLEKLGINNITDDELQKNRSNLMGRVFYEYTSSTEGKSKIDRHNIVMALDQWTWFWIVLEANFYLLFVTIIFCFSEWRYALTLAVTMILSSTYMNFSYKESIKNVNAQISEILANEEFKNEIKGVFDEISSNG